MSHLISDVGTLHRQAFLADSEEQTRILIQSLQFGLEQETKQKTSKTSYMIRCYAII